MVVEKPLTGKLLPSHISLSTSPTWRRLNPSIGTDVISLPAYFLSITMVNCLKKTKIKKESAPCNKL